jgi:hypothetical protein
MTTATRFSPDLAFVSPQISSKVTLTRGSRVLPSSPTAYRQPSTLPSAGLVWSGPLGANFQVSPLSWK